MLPYSCIALTSKRLVTRKLAATFTSSFILGKRAIGTASVTMSLLITGLCVKDIVIRNFVTKDSNNKEHLGYAPAYPELEPKLWQWLWVGRGLGREKWKQLFRHFLWSLLIKVNPLSIRKSLPVFLKTVVLSTGMKATWRSLSEEETQHGDGNEILYRPILDPRAFLVLYTCIMSHENYKTITWKNKHWFLPATR